jgi:hypothetical protein
MLTSLHIENFRAFRELRIDGLARVNLITGANNTGKTALLEGLVLFLDKTDSERIRQLERQFRPVVPGDSSPDFWDWLLTDRASEGQCLFTGVFYPAIQGSRGWTFKQQATNKTGPFALGTRQAWPFGNRSTSSEKLTAFSTIPGRRGNGAIAYNRVILKKRRKPVENLLREIEPRLVTVESLQVRPNSPMLYADIGLPEMFPVTQLGQGFNRLLEIYSELVVEEAGSVLIDEIENGLYWKTLPIVWRGLFAAAREWDVQIFATTHSAECIRAADEAARLGGKYDLAVIRLDRVDGEIKATTMGEETLRTAKEFGWELR